MKKKSILLLILLLALLTIIIPFVISVNKFIDKFNEMGKLSGIENAHKLKSSKLILKNVRTFQNDTIEFKKVIVINFWATWCKPCIEEQISLEQLANNVTIIQLSFDSIENQRKVINSNKWTIPAYALSDTSFFKKPTIFPTTLILKDSTIIRRIYGQQNWTDSSFTNYFNTIK